MVNINMFLSSNMMMNDKTLSFKTMLCSISVYDPQFISSEKLNICRYTSLIEQGTCK